MSRISPRDFVGTRARFQRMRDAKIFNGWIENFFGNKLEVATSSQVPVEVGDEFRFEGFGHHITMVFQCELDSINAIDVLTGGLETVIEGSNAKVLESYGSTFVLKVTGQIRFASSNEAVRIKVSNLPGSVLMGPKEVQAKAVDVSPGGVGMIVEEKLEIGSDVRMNLETNFGTLTGIFEVMYCVEDIRNAGYYRTGLKIKDMDRIERPRWDRFMREIH
ncbi:MAG: PilZ domain-containing protein [Fimbriimonadaceae bacterium]